MNIKVDGASLNAERDASSNPQGSKMYEARNLLKNSIQKASIKSRTGNPGPEFKSHSLRKICGILFSGVIYLVSLVIICVLVFHFLF